MEMKEDELVQPVSPTAQHMNSSVQSISLIVVLELEMAIDELQFMSFAKHFIHLNPLFTSIMVLSLISTIILCLNLGLSYSRFNIVLNYKFSLDFIFKVDMFENNFKINKTTFLMIMF